MSTLEVSTITSLPSKVSNDKYISVMETLNTSNATNQSESGSQYFRKEKIVELFVLGIIEVLILFGNALVITAFFKGPRRIRTITNYFVVNLAISDLMVGVLSVPFWFTTELDLAPDNFNKYVIPLDILFGTTSILSLVAISLERMYAVKRPTSHFNLSRKPIYASISLTWAIGICLTLVNIFLFDRDKIITTFVIFTLAFLVPLVIIIVSYILIFAAAYKMIEADNHKNNRLSRDLQIAKTISVIIGLFFVCWAPFFSINLAYVLCETCTDWGIPVSVTKLLHYSNSMMNVFVYAARSPDYRDTFKALLCKCDTTEVRSRLRTMSFQTATRKSTTGSNERTRSLISERSATLETSVGDVRIRSNNNLYDEAKLKNGYEKTNLLSVP